MTNPHIDPRPCRPASDPPNIAEDSLVVALARAVDRTGRRVEGLDAAVAQLAADMITLARTLSGGRPGDETSGEEPAAVRSWLALPPDRELAAQVFAELVDWLAAVYLRFTDGATHLPECWAWHPEVVEELLWLMHAWAEAYHPERGTWARVGDWHDRQRLGVVRRVRAAAGACSFERHIDRPGWDTLTGAAPTVPGTDALPSLAEWWATRREGSAPEPPARVVPVPEQNGRGRRW